MEETQVEQPFVTVDGEKYLLDEISDTAKVAIQHLKKLDDKVNDMQFDLDELKIARLGFMSILKTELNPNETLQNSVPS